MIETEAKMKVSLDEFNRIHNRLGRPEFVLQKNWGYFTSDGYARVREESDKSYITLKKKINESNLSREEIEFEISNSSSARDMIKGLGLLDEYYYEKRRASCNRGNVIICLDDVKDLGYFVEIEGEEKDINFCLNELELNLRKREEKSYFEMIRGKSVSIDSYFG